MAGRAHAESVSRAIERDLLEGASAGIRPGLLAERHGVGIDYIRKIRDELVRDGRLERVSSQRYRPTGPVVGIPANITSTSELFEHLAKMPVLTAQEAMRYLSYLATSGPDTVKVPALKALEDLRRSDELRRAASASLPITVEEKLARLAILKAGVGSHLFSIACGCVRPGATVPPALRKELSHAVRTAEPQSPAAS